jgi:two-component system NtrC family sensor kinase
VAQGDLNSRVEVRRQDEIGELAAHFNEMTGVLRCRAEEQGRFAAAGQLIAGVAHEVNNPLMAIAALTDSRLEDTDLPAELRDDLQQMRRQARRAGKLLSGLLRFVRAGEPLGTSLALNDVVQSAVDLVSYRFGVDEITLELRLDPSLPRALGSAGRIEQVIVNLLSNGLDALRGTARPRRLTVDTWTGDGKVFAAVTDSGEGIVPMMERRLFMPFATTKGADGTGLGLYISRQILRESGGELRYEPATRGARFVMELIAAPLDAVVDSNGSTPRARSGRLEPTLRGVQVLVVDDEPAVRQPIARFLGRRGALVREAGDGHEALKLIEALEPAVLLVDLRMPRMDGMELCERMAREWPHLLDKVIILSGDLSQLGDALPVPADRVLAKPVELREIEQRLVAAVGGA